MNQAEKLMYGANPRPLFSISTDSHLSIERFLDSLIADTYRLFVNTSGIHWNVSGPLFNAIREISKQQAAELFEAVGAIAERKRSLGGLIPQQFDKLPALSALDDVDNSDRVEIQITKLAELHEILVMNIKDRLSNQTGLHLDPKTEAVLTERVGAHERHAWMLRAITE